MNTRRRGRLLDGILALMSACGALSAQEPPFNTALRGRWNDYTGVYSEVTSDGNYLYGGNCGRCDGNEARVFVVDITDPSNPQLANEVLIPPPNNFCSPEDIFYADGLLFVAMESQIADAVAVFDARNPPALPLIATVRLGGYQRAHNVQFHEGLLYVADSTTPRVGIADLRTFDPDNPPPSPYVNDLWILSGVGSSFVHEILPITLPPPYGKVLYCAGWNSGVLAYDLDNVTTSEPTLLGSAPGISTHSMWPTSDGRFVVSAEERAGGGIKVWEVAAGSPTSWSFELRDSLVLNSEAFCVHNPYLVGNRLFNSWYQAGLQVFDVDPVTGGLMLAASYDTTPATNSGTYSGNWSVFPFLGEDKIVLSDMQQGYFVVALQQPLFTLHLLPVDRIDPQDGAVQQVAVTPGTSLPDPNDAKLFYRVDGGPAQIVSMVANGQSFEGQFGAQRCGSEIQYWVVVGELGGTGQSVSEPANAPAGFHTAPVADAILVADAYDFESTVGWAVSGLAAAGHWQAGVPAGDGTRGDPAMDYDGSGQCYLTQNAPGNTDVDGGSTVLTSPMLDMSSLQDPVLSYARWFTNSSGGVIQDDALVVEISNNGGASWVNLETVGPNGGEVAGGWFFKRFHVAGTIAPTASMRVRFVASDMGMASLVEAAIDAVSIRDFHCEPGSCCLRRTCTDNVIQPQCGGVFRPDETCAVPCGCLINADCDDGSYCNGAEVCVDGGCLPGGDPCAPSCCSEMDNQCVPCNLCGNGMLDVGESCDDGDMDNCNGCNNQCELGGPPCGVTTSCRLDSANNACNHMECSAISCVCEYTCVRYGDLRQPPNGIADLDDILCVLAGFGNLANCVDADIAPCGSNGIVNLDDILAVLGAFSGGDPCGCTDEGTTPLCGSIDP